LSNSKIQKSALFAGILLFTYVFLKNAWVCDDAYLIFRSLKQLFAGNGSIWNPHERVQVFTSPLWFWLQTPFRIFSKDVFCNVIFVSAIMCGLTLLIIKKMFRDNTKWFLFIVLLLCSSGFSDYMTSGLENPLGYFLIAFYLYCYHQLFTERHSDRNEISLALRLFFTFGLIILCRHDFATLLLAPTLFVFWTHRRKLSPRKWTFSLCKAFLPFIAWSLFALIYYGDVFPNTAYSKLNTGISRGDLISQGIKYFFMTFWHDAITLVVISIATFCSFFAKKKYVVFLSCGILTNLAYVLFIGGGFMQGRFLSYAYLVSVIILLFYWIDIDILNNAFTVQIKITDEKKSLFLILIISLLYVFFYPHTPIKSPIDYENKDVSWGITDERGYYFRSSSLWQYIKRNKKNDYFPDHNGSRLGFEFSKSQDKIYSERQSIGAFGYWAGTDKIIIDVYGLTDPLLARLPIPSGEWRIGHFARDIPTGYAKSTLNDSAELEDTGINEFYKKVKLITQSKKLFTWERIKTIIAMNLGLYNHYLENKKRK